MAKILMVEDDKPLGVATTEWLVAERHTVEVVHSGQEALERLALYKYDIMILDWGLPDISGVDVCKKFRASGGATPVLMLTGKQSIGEKETGFESGADDYLTKPFEVRELSLRLKALLRRPSVLPGAVLKVRDLVLELGAYRLTKKGQEIQLSPKEYALLEFLMRHPNRVYSAELLLRSVWEADAEVGPETIRTHVKNLRNKVDSPGQPSILTTVHGIGYKLDVPDLIATEA